MCRADGTAEMSASRLLTLLPRPYRLVYNGTFMVTNQTGSIATLTFNGTSVWLYGSKGENYGTYKVTLDDAPTPSYVGDGFSEEDVSQQVLFEARGLDGTSTH